jgi:tRNA dimethylallyltransferase
LSKVDAQQAQLIHANNRKRVLRAISIAMANQKSKTELISEQTHSMLYDAKILACTLPRVQLYQRLNSRVEKMMEAGLLDEVKQAVVKAGWDHPVMSAIGYKEFKDYLDEKISLDDAISLVKRNTRRFAKRQITWFMHQMPCRWVNMDDEIEVNQAIEEVKVWMSR